MRNTIGAFLFVTLLMGGGAAQATLLHPDVMGTTVWYRSIQESSPSDALPLYGQPIANADQLVFPLIGAFSAESLGGGAPDHTDGKLNFTVESKPGFALASLNVQETGLTALDAPFGGDAFAEVIGFAAIKVLEVAGAPVDLPAISAFFSISPLSGQYQLSSIGGSSFATGWSGSVNIPLPQFTTKASVVIDNSLLASTLGSGTRAFIDKKAFDVTTDTVIVIPEPAAGLLALSAIVGTCLRRRQAA